LRKNKFDIVVIGAGVIGCSIARELSRYNMRVLVVEQHSDICEEASKANGGQIHAGYGNRPNTLKGTLSARGNKLTGPLCEELEVPYKEVGSVVLAFTKEDIKTLETLEEWGRQNGVPTEIISREKLLDREPNANLHVIAALLCPKQGILSPFELTIALAENAIQNGVMFSLNTQVRDIITDSGQILGIQTNKGFYPARFIINAAGVWADAVSEMAGADYFHITPRKGEAFILDKFVRDMITGIVFPPPSEITKGVAVILTIEENLFIGSTAKEIEDKTDVSTSEEGFNYLVQNARRIWPAFKPEYIIGHFAGLRASSDRGDFIIEPAPEIYGLINVAGIESPGLAAAPAIAKMTVEILKDQGLKLVSKANFMPRRKKRPHFRDLSHKEKDDMVKVNPAWGKIICRCEMVTEAEIINAIRRPLGATTLDGIKRRTHAMSGPCQGSFCSAKIAQILSRELNITMERVTKKGKSSFFSVSKIEMKV